MGRRLTLKDEGGVRSALRQVEDLVLRREAAEDVLVRTRFPTDPSRLAFFLGFSTLRILEELTLIL